MQWIILCLLAALFVSISVFIDNYMTDVVFKSKKPQAIKVIDAFLYLILAIIIATIFGLKEIPITLIILAIISGAITSLASLPYYLGLRDEEATTATIFFQIIPVLCIIGDFFILGHTITQQQIYGFILILIAPFIITLARQHKKTRKLELRASLLLLAHAILYAIGSVIYAKAGQDKPDTMTLYFWFIIGRTLFDFICTIFIPSLRKRIKQVLKVSPTKLIITAVSTLVFALAGDFLLRYSYTFTTTSLATVLSNASELIITFILGIILTIIWPKFGREKLNRHIIISHLIAVILVVIGIILTNL